MEDALRDCDHRMLRITARGERVRGLGRNDSHLRHREVRLLRHLTDDAIEGGGFRLGDELRPVRPEDNSVGGEVRDSVHDAREYEEH